MAYGHDGSLIERFTATLNYRSNRLGLLRHTDIGQENQSRVRDSSHVDKPCKALVHGDENPVLCSRSFQQGSIAWVWAEGSRFQNVVSILAQPVRQSPPNT